MTNKINSLYIHIPFCKQICVYCDFYKMIAKEEKINEYIDYLIKDLSKKKSLLNDIENIYIGGGTPSSIGFDNLNRLLTSINTLIKNIKEFSIECNVLDINQEMLALFKKQNITRLSLGIQSTNDAKLSKLGRTHNKNDIINALNLLKLNNFNNINADIIYGYKDDSVESIINDLDLLKNYVNHFSCYSLILEEHTMLYNDYRNNKFQIFDEEEDAKIYENIQMYLEKNDFIQYEVSNFCKNDTYCFYNLNTWNNGYYLGIGASASYYYNNVRYTNPKNLKKYYELVDNINNNYYELISLTKKDKLIEKIMLGLRLIKGINVKNINDEYNIDILNLLPSINTLIKNNYVLLQNEYLSINKSKIYISNSIINLLLNDVEKYYNS